MNQHPTSRRRAVADLMSTPPVTARPGDTMADVAVRMEKERVSCVVVVEGEGPVGILTERDVVRFAASGTDAATTPATDWMTARPDTVEPGTEAGAAFTNLAERGYRHIPVVDGGALVGVVSMRDLMKVAQIQPMLHPGELEAPKGLAGVIVADTVVGDVRGQEGFYHYRQYSARELADKRTLEDVWFLLFDGDLPTADQRASFADDIRPQRRLPEAVRSLLPAIAGAGEAFVPLDALRSVVSLTAATLGFRPSLDITAEELRADAVRLCALVPTLCAALFRLRRGEEPVEPDPELAHAANYLWMLTGRRPEPEHARAVEQYLISTVDHGFNASTFSARVITSTGADVGAAVTGAIGALSGPLHGAAPSRALDMLEAIGEPGRAEEWIRREVAAGGRIMGFGHRVYKTEDPRSALLRKLAQRLGGDKAEFAATVERTIVEVLAELKPGRELYANVEFYAGVVMEGCGIPPEMFTPTFASSRVIGWCANILEQASDNRIIRQRPLRRAAGAPARPRAVTVEEVADVTSDVLAAFARLVPQLSGSSSPPTEAELAEIVASPTTVVLVAREDGGDIVGTLTLALFRIPTGLRAWIEDVVVDEGARGGGVGEALTRAALERATAAGARSVDLTSRSAREAANRLYRRLGFEQRDTNVYRWS